MRYSEKLKNPKWQKKRLEILDRDGFTCRLCSNTKKTLHVHHLLYDGKDPWETPPGHLITLCEDCHADIHSGVLLPTMVRVCSKLIKDNGMANLESLDIFVNGFCMGKKAILMEERDG